MHTHTRDSERSSIVSRPLMNEWNYTATTTLDNAREEWIDEPRTIDRERERDYICVG